MKDWIERGELAYKPGLRGLAAQAGLSSSGHPIVVVNERLRTPG